MNTAESNKMCTRCILPETTPGITFDEDNVCNYCRTYQNKTVKGEKLLLDLLNESKERSKNNKYDCMIGVSGGRDSTFLMWKLAHDYKMRVLAVHYDNPFSSDQATQNLESAAKQLGVDLVKWTYSRKNWHIDETRRALEIWSSKPSASMLPIICAVCKNWWPDFFKIAKANSISLIIIGSNQYESATFKEASFGSARTYFNAGRILKTIAKGLSELARNPGYLRCSWTAVIRGFVLASHSSPFVRAFYHKYTVVRLFDYIEWDEKMVLDTIENNLGWSRDPQHPSPWRFDCRMDHVKKFLYKKMTGVSELTDLFCKMIREGKMTREEALARLEVEDVTPRNLVDEVLGSMDLDMDSLGWKKEWFD